MSKRTLTLVTSVTGGVGAIASAVVTYFHPAMAGAIVASIDIGCTAIIAICTQFVEPDATKSK